MKLELKHLSPYLQYDLNVIDDDGNPAILCALYSINVCYVQYEMNVGDYELELSEIKPILKQLSDYYTEALKDALIAACKIDLSNCTFEESDIEFDARNETGFLCWINAEENGCVVSSLSFDGNGFEIHYRNEVRDWQPANQTACFNEFAKHHIDWQLLIDAGLAIDINTLK